MGAVLHFLRDEKQNISGFSDDVDDPYGLFVERLRGHDAGLLQLGLVEADRLSKTGKKWEELTKGAGDADNVDKEGGFSFGFGGGDYDDEIL